MWGGTDSARLFRMEEMMDFSYQTDISISGKAFGLSVILYGVETDYHQPRLRISGAHYWRLKKTIVLL
jgi:hypothetical protein